MLASDLKGMSWDSECIGFGWESEDSETFCLRHWSMFLSYHRLLILTTHSNNHTTCRYTVNSEGFKIKV